MPGRYLDNPDYERAMAEPKEDFNTALKFATRPVKTIEYLAELMYGKRIHFTREQWAAQLAEAERQWYVMWHMETEEVFEYTKSFIDKCKKEEQ